MNQLDPVSLRFRTHLRDLSRTFESHLRASTECQENERRHVRSLAVSRLCDSETTERQHLWESFLEIFRREEGRRALIDDKAARKDAGLRLQTARQTNRYNALAAAYDATDAANEERFRQDGLFLLDQQRHDEEQKRLRLEARRSQMKADMEGFRAVKAYVEGDQTRRRTSLETEEGHAWHHFQLQFKAGINEVHALRQQRLELEKSLRKRAEDDSAEAARKIRERQEGEVRKEQTRLAMKCTHSRNGSSVFVGPFPKKMCLLCKVKLDAKTGLLYQM
jgi:hypothetical protein